MTMSDIIDKAKVLEEENKVLNQNLEDAEIVNKTLSEKVALSKEIIQKLIGLYFYPITTEDDLKRQNNIIAEAKAFIGGKE